MTKGDKYIVVFLLLISLVGILYQTSAYAGGGSKWAEISVNGKVIQKVQLKEGYRQEIQVGGEKEFDVIEIKDGAVRIKEADCPDQDCIKTGWISRPGQQIVCLPYRLVVKIDGTDIDNIDTITR